MFKKYGPHVKLRKKQVPPVKTSVYESGEDQVNGVKAVIKASNVRIFGLAPSEKSSNVTC